MPPSGVGGKKIGQGMGKISPPSPAPPSDSTSKLQLRRCPSCCAAAGDVEQLFLELLLLPWRRGGRKKIVSAESSSSSLAPGWDESQYAPSSSSDTFSGDFLRSFCPAVVTRHAEYGLQIPQFGIDMLIKKMREMNRNGPKSSRT